ncbi:MAG: DUF2460 domain-containing protein [Lysobacter sp.]
MSFIDHRLSDDVAYGFTGGPQWDTLTRRLRSGHETRNAQMELPLHKYSADYATLEGAAKEELLAAFWVSRGAWAAFRFRDYNDYTVADAPLEHPAVDTDPIQLTKTYTFGPTAYVRTITLPLTVAMTNAGAPFTDFTFDPLTGLATPTTAWPAGAKAWTGEFDVRVKFSRDYNPFSRRSPKVSTAMVDLEEVFR